MSLPNIYHLRRVSDTSAKACMICYKPSTSVLITPDNKDFFYICPSHLKDRNFCSPIVDEEGEKAKLKEDAMAKEVEKVKREYEEKQKRKEKEKKEKEKKEDEKDKDDKKDENSKTEDKDKDEKERDDKINSIKSNTSTIPTSTSDDPRIFSLHKNFYQMRINRLRDIEVAKRNRQRLQDPSLFPSVPTGGL